MKSQDPSDPRDPRLQHLDFSEPVEWSESTAQFTNDKQQEFEIKVRGINSSVVSEYVKTLHVSFEVVPLEDVPRESDPPRQEDQAEQDQDREEEEEEDVELEIEMEILDTQGVELPYLLKAVFDPPIGKRPPQAYFGPAGTVHLDATLSATDGGVEGTLSGAGLRRNVKVQADTFPGEAGLTAALSVAAVNPRKKFKFSVRGIEPTNEFEYLPVYTFR